MRPVRSFPRVPRRSTPPASARVELLEDRTLLATVPAGFSESVAASGISNATAMAFAPDGKLFVAEQAGVLQVWEDNVQVSADFLANEPISTTDFFERGLLGIAFDPNYAVNRYVYLYYTTTEADNHNRVSRFTSDANGLLALAGSEHIIMELDPHSAGNHNGGAIHFGTDGMLYIAVGDNASGGNAQSLANRHGKMLRIDVHVDDFPMDSGQNYGIPADNPTAFPGIAGSTSGVNQSIWAVGLRNPFTFAVQPGTGRLFINDVGQNTWEEIDEGASGANYGWPFTEGDFNPATFPNFTQPFYTYDHGGAQPNGCSIAGGAFYDPAAAVYPAQYHGDYFFADYCEGRIWSVDLTTKAVTEFASGINRPVDLKVGDDGALYYLARNSQTVMRIQFDVPPPSVVGTEVNGGVGNPNRSGAGQLTIDFDQFATVDAATSLNLFNHTTGQSIDLSAAALLNNGTTSVSWDLSAVALANGHYTAELPRATTQGVNGLLLTQTHTFEFHVLSGDLDGDGTVNFNDTGPLSLNFGVTGAAPYTDGDGDGDGDVNFDDTVPLSLNFGSSLTDLTLDFGDAPEAATSFPTTLAENGARHVITGNALTLGATRDDEPDGQPSAGAVDDGPDEDGVAIATLEVGTNALYVVASTGAGFVNAWVDFNQDGDWDDVDEQIFVDEPVVVGVNGLQANVPGGAVLGTTIARFRLTGTAGYSYFGLAPDGEVEDYQVTVADPPVDSASDVDEPIVASFLPPTFVTFDHPLSKFATNAQRRGRGR